MLEIRYELQGAMQNLCQQRPGPWWRVVLAWYNAQHIPRGRFDSECDMKPKQAREAPNSFSIIHRKAVLGGGRMPRALQVSHRGNLQLRHHLKLAEGCQGTVLPCATILGTQQCALALFPRVPQSWPDHNTNVHKAAIKPPVSGITWCSTSAGEPFSASDGMRRPRSSFKLRKSRTGGARLAILKAGQFQRSLTSPQFGDSGCWVHLGSSGLIWAHLGSSGHQARRHRPR